MFGARFLLKKSVSHSKFVSAWIGGGERFRQMWVGVGSGEGVKNHWKYPGILYGWPLFNSGKTQGILFWRVYRDPAVFQVSVGIL